MTSTTPAPPEPYREPDQDRPRRISSPVSRGDRVFRAGLTAAGLSVFLIMGLIAFFLLLRGGEALKVTGWSFLTEQRWNTGAHQFGIASVLPNGALIALVALLISVPVALGTAVFISEYAPVRLRAALISLIDLMAAIPSIVYGLWGLVFLQPRIVGLSRWLSNHLGDWVPFLKVRRGDITVSYTSSTFIAGVVVSLMIIPIVTSLSREVFSQAPQGEREGAYALGSTRWGMVRTVVLPFGRGGVIGAVMLGFGRAMGETIAVALIISPAFVFKGHLLENGANSISALIALRYSESDELSLSALMAAGLVLFALTLLVNLAAGVIINRSRSGAATSD
ncbi:MULTISPECIES: phosphate ABC transporter permease subunit PstC [unclassified Kitasatospora]|uniref:phosphate ABC transporter permease subunit PstC n=1 Tax=unclassified Kitasatospora TaxID=2633591 RepID=UPI00070AAB5D|nr:MULTISPECIES: phosphate ABC transporter permease subunit PstC [unclassified Kitasatospora]KQV09833.1 phosphate ABC transporter permease [Kitasatospora sp. Root107]KRB70072.1 phosphate ABC transporter permease [Kitasatospora sp. Root187]